jgi:hypothetical protein
VIIDDDVSIDELREAVEHLHGVPGVHCEHENVPDASHSPADPQIKSVPMPPLPQSKQWSPGSMLDGHEPPPSVPGHDSRTRRDASAIAVVHIHPGDTPLGLPGTPGRPATNSQVPSTLCLPPQAAATVRARITGRQPTT